MSRGATHLVVVVVQVLPDGLESTTKRVMGEPPLEVGLIQVTTADAFRATACTDRGIVGRASVVTAALVEPPHVRAMTIVNDPKRADCFEFLRFISLISEWPTAQRAEARLFGGSRAMRRLIDL